MKRIKKIIVLLLVLAMVFSVTACKNTESEKISENEIEYSKTYGEGNKSFTFEVTNKAGVTTYFLVKTDKEIVGDSLLDLGLINGTESSYGLYVTEVNKETLDWDKDQMYWAFYIDGEYAITGVDMTNIEEGKVYSFKASK